MTLLAIDSSTRTLGLAIYDGADVLYECTWTGQDHHGVELSPGIQRALRASGLKARDLKAVAIAIGPGSYTGVRIGLAIAKGLAFAQRLALIAVPSLDIVAAAQAVQDLPMVAVLHAGRGRLAAGRYKAKKGQWLADGQPQLMTAEELTDTIQYPTLICGELSEAARKVLARKYKNAVLQTPAWSVRRPAILAELAWGRWQVGEVDDPKGLAPIYLQANETVAV